MKKIAKMVLTLGVLCATLSGCNTNATSQMGVVDTTTPPDVEVWSAYSTAKVMQDPALNVNHKKMAAVIDVASCLGEEEDGQLIITANEKVDWYSLKTADLKNENGDVFSTDNIWVYNQFYHDIYLKSQNRTDNMDFYPLGYTPDALAPQAGSERNKENFIKAGNNQGITVTFNVPSDQKPGVYTGTFTLIIDGYKKAIPVRLKVWNIDNTYMHGKTAWDLWNGGVQSVELDTLNIEGYSRAIKEAEYDFWVSKRQNPMRLPAEFGGAEAWAENVAELWANPRFNSFVFDDMYGDKERIKEWIMAFVETSNRDSINYLSAAAFYEKQADEPYSDPGKMQNCINWLRTTMEALEECATIVENDGSLFVGKDELRAEVAETIRSIPFLITGMYEKMPKEVLELANNFCPGIDWYETEAQRAYYENRQETQDNFSAWTYTCMFPTYPMPSQAVDDYSLGIRVMGWMMKDFNISGYLNWDGNMSYYRNPYYTGNDPYEDTLRLYLEGNGCFMNGDGYLVYPGKRYDQEAPVGSIRMNAFRDMQEDYDMLYVFEEQYNELVKKYGANAEAFDPVKLLETVYQSLYEGNVYYTDEELVLKAREQVAGWMESMTESGLLFNYKSVGENVTVSLYADADEVYINGLKTTGTAANSGKYYQRMLNLSDGDTQVSVRLVKNGKSTTHTYSVGQKSYTLLDSKSITANDVVLSKGSAYDAATGLFTMRSGGETMADKLTFQVRAKIALPQAMPLTDIGSLSFEYINESDSDVFVKFGYYSGNSTYIVNEFIVKANSIFETIDLRVYETDDWNKTEIEGFVLVFENVDENQVLLSDRKFRIGSVRYSKPKGGNK